MGYTLEQLEAAEAALVSKRKEIEVELGAKRKNLTEIDEKLRVVEDLKKQLEEGDPDISVPKLT